MSHLRKVFERERGFKAEGHYGGFDAVYVEWLETKVEKLTSENNDMSAISAIEGALKIADLWLPKVVTEEHAGESEALHSMHSAFLSVVQKQRHV